jgi:hypothetical protein
MSSRPKQIVLSSHREPFIVFAKLFGSDLLLGNLTLSSANQYSVAEETYLNASTND